jgi:tetratricopeptide (TPR) repeat protein
VGGSQFGAFTVMGDVVNVAYRLEELARAGHVLVSESAYQLTRDVVRYTALPPMHVRGKDAPISAYELEAIGEDNTSAQPRLSPPFAGRQTELARLGEVLLANAGPRAISLVGPSGIGKSRLIDEFRVQHTQAVWAIVRCLEYEHASPFSTLRWLVQALVQHLQPTPEEDRLRVAAEATLADLAGSAEQPGTRDSLANTLALLLASLGPVRPVVLALDDAHRADRESLEALELTSERLPRQANVVLLTAARTRPVGNWPGAAEVIWLEPLGAAECARFIAQASGLDDIAPSAVQRLTHWSGGHPLALEEIVAASLEDRVWRQVDERWDLMSLPHVGRAYRLRASIQSELDRLTASQRELLRIACVVEPGWTACLLRQALAADKPLEEDVLALVELGYLARTNDVDPPRYRFRLEFASAVIDASLPQLERRRLHERVALALQRSYDPDRPNPDGLKRIAAHFAQAGHAWRAVEYLLRAADTATAGSSPRAAVVEYRSVLRQVDWLTDPKERARLDVEVNERIGDALLAQGDFPEAQVAFELAAVSTTSPQRRAELQVKLGLTGVRRGNPRRVLELAENIAADGGHDVLLRTSAETLKALGLAMQGRVAPALERANEALRLAAASGDQGALGSAHSARAQAAYLAGNLEDAVVEFERSGAAWRLVPEESGWFESQVMLGSVYIALGRLADAEGSIRRALGLAGQQAPADSHPHAVSTIDAARPATGPESPPRWILASAELAYGRLLVYRGQHARAARHLRSAHRTTQRAGARELAQAARLALAGLAVERARRATPAEAAATRGALDAAIDEARSVIEVAQALELVCLECSARTLLSVALAERASASGAQRSDGEDAAAQAREALATAETLGLRLHSALARRALGLAFVRTGDVGQAAAQLDEAAAVLEHLGARAELARTLVLAVRAEYAAPRSNRTQLRAKLARAIELGEALGLDDDRLAALRLHATVAE